MLARLLTDPISYFLFFWTPKYLQDERGFDLKQVGLVAWIPFVALGAGNIFGGAIPRWLANRGWTVNRARKTTMLGVSCGMVAVCTSSGNWAWFARTSRPEESGSSNEKD